MSLTLEREGHTCLPSYWGSHSNTWHPSEAAGLEAKGPEENGFLLGPGSVPGWCGKEG